MTQEGLDKLKAELEELKTKTRYEVIEKLRYARSLGDLSENSEYDEAKDEQARVEERIKQLENQIKFVKVISDEEITTDAVGVGVFVKVHDYEFDEDIEYQIVGSTEANIMENKLSNESPVGAGLIGAKVGEEVSIETPDGPVKYKILEIHR